MTSKNGADFVHVVMPALAPASQHGQSRDKKMIEMAAFEEFGLLRKELGHADDYP
jgi:hypothetical protein